jgi:hypothetical protein
MATRNNKKWTSNCGTITSPSGRKIRIIGPVGAAPEAWQDIGDSIHAEAAYIANTLNLFEELGYTKTVSLIKDAERLDKLDKLRTDYSRPPFRAVTGWQWRVVDETGAEDVRTAIDSLK